MRGKGRFIFVSLLLALCAVRVDVAHAHPAWGIVVDRAGQIIFSDLETIWKLDAQGRLSVVRAGVTGRHVHELTLDEAGNLYGADISYRAPEWISAVWRITPTGAFSYLITPTTNPPRGLSLIRDRASNTYFVEPNTAAQNSVTLLRRTPDGRISTLAGGRTGQADGQGAQAQFRALSYMTLAPDGALYMIDGGALRRVTLDGAVSTIARDLDKHAPEEKATGETYGGFMGLCVDAQGRVFVTDYPNRRVLQAQRDGRVSTALRARAPWAPAGVAVGRGGELYVLEIGFVPPRTYVGPRVRRLLADGRSDVLVEVGQTEHAAGTVAGRSVNDGGAATVADEIDADQNVAVASSGQRRAVKFSIVVLGLLLVAVGALVWRRRDARKRDAHVVGQLESS